MAGIFRSTKTLNPGKGYPCTFRNWRAESHCRFIHGYDLMFQITLACEDKDRDNRGWVFDFSAYDHMKMELEHWFDHTTIIAMDDPAMDEFEVMAQLGVCDLRRMPETSCEAFAAWTARTAADMLHKAKRLGPVWVVEARVYEHMGNSASYVPGTH